MIGDFIRQLRRRNVMRVAVAYAVVAWLLLQIVDVVAPMLGVPDWTGALILLVLAVGFPVALLLAWAFELTPEGIKRANEVRTDESVARARWRMSNLVIVTGLGIVVLALAVDKFIGFDEEADDATTLVSTGRSIAILPFENMSRDEANDPFTNGLHDDVLTQISRISALKVISRTSVMEYRDTKKNLKTIGEELGVATVLQGGVQRAGERVRVNVQLTDTRSDRAIWANTYDRRLTAADVFSIQTEIATSIAAVLQTTVTAAEKQRLATVPTENIAALEAYFLGKQLVERRTHPALEAAVEQFERAVELDPGFALAYAGLAAAYMLLPEYAANVDPEFVRERSVAAATRAMSLDPNLPEALTSMAWSRLIHEYDWAGSASLLKQAIDLQPNNAHAMHWLSHVQSWQGEHAEAMYWARRGIEVDPLSSLMHSNLSYILMDAGEFDEAREVASTLAEQDPAFHANRRHLWLLELRAGRPAEAARALQKWAAATGRDVQAAEEVGRQFVRYKRTGKPAPVFDEVAAGLALGSEDLAQIYAFTGDAPKTLESLERAYEERSGSRSVLSMKVNPGYDFIRTEPRFMELLDRVGLAESGPR